jgi:hypothetical protein
MSQDLRLVFQIALALAALAMLVWSNATEEQVDPTGKTLTGSMRRESLSEGASDLILNNGALS